MDVSNAWVECLTSLKIQRGRTVPNEAYIRNDLSCGLESCSQCNVGHCVLDSGSPLLMPDAEALSAYHEVLQLPEVENVILLNSVMLQSKLSKARERRTRVMIRDKRKRFSLFDDIHHAMTHPRSALVPHDQVAAHLPPYCSPSILDGSSRQVAHLRQMLSSAAFLLMHWRETSDDDPPPIVIVSSFAQPSEDPSEDQTEVEEDDTSLDALLSLMDLGQSDVRQRSAGSRPLWPPARGMIHIMSPEQLFSVNCWGKTHQDSSAVKLAKDLQAISTQGSSVPLDASDVGCATAHWNQAQVMAGLASGQLIKGRLDVSRRSRREGVVIVSSISSRSWADDDEGDGAIDEDGDNRGQAGDSTRMVDGEQLGRVLRVSGLARMNRAIHGDLVVVRLIPYNQAPEDSSLHDPDLKGEDGEVAAIDVFDLGDNGGEGTRGQAVDLSGPRGPPPSLPLAQVVAILSREQNDVVACLRREDEESLSSSSTTGSEVVIALPLDPRLPLVRIKTRQAQHLVNQRFIMRIDGWAYGSKRPTGHVVRKLGPLGDLKAESDAVLIKCGINHLPFCQGAIDELPRVSSPSEWRIEESARMSRRDLRDCMVCSIDPPGCTDVDDALHVKYLPSGLVEVGVHIADVSHLSPRSGSFLDSEAKDRCTSIYLVDRRLDMLPALLSEYLCSLRAGSERFAVSVVWTLSPSSFEVKDVWMGRSIIKSRYQLTYQEAQDIFEGRSPQYIPPSDAIGLRSSVLFLFDYTRALRARRKEAGALLELAGSELRFLTDPVSGKPIEVSRKEKLEAMDMIAEMMILANSCVAERIVRSNPASALLRNHPPPLKKSLDMVAPFLASNGPLDLTSNKKVAEALDKAVAKMRAQDDKASASLISSLLTRSMNEAQYLSSGSISTGSQYHYGLAVDFYTHFSSPIRRYADIIVHRQLLKSASTSHHELVAMASRMNERHRQAKEASKICSELYLLDLFATAPQIVEALVVRVVAEQSKPVLLEFYIPDYAMKGVVRLVDQSGIVKPPLGYDHQDSKDLTIKISSLTDDATPQSIEIVTRGDKVIWTATERGTAFVQLGAGSSREHGLSLQASLCLDPQGSFRHHKPPVSPPFPTLPCPKAEITRSQQVPKDDAKVSGDEDGGWRVTHHPMPCVLSVLEDDTGRRELRLLMARLEARIDRTVPGSKQRSELMDIKDKLHVMMC